VLNSGILTDLEFFYSLNALLMGKCLMAVFVRVFVQKVTANICPIELFVRGLIHFGR
jgi:hypothetical protein